MAVNFDHHRKGRTGLNEVILAEPKQLIDLKEAISEALKGDHPVLITRIDPSQVEVIEESATFHDTKLEFDRYQRTAILGTIHEIDTDQPQVAILSGGTSDQPIVEEIQMSLRYFGLAGVQYPDVGVAGIHRHQKVLQEIADIASVSLLIVVAGNEGALFSVVSGQTTLPIVAVPASVGYGFGGKGETALRSALQSCSPGVVTVNIDNGFGAASFARKLLSE